MQSTGQASTQAVSFTPMQGSAMTYAIGHLLLQSYASRREDSSEAEVNCWHHGNHGGENFGDTLRRGDFTRRCRGLDQRGSPTYQATIMGCRNGSRSARTNRAVYPIRDRRRTS